MAYLSSDNIEPGYECEIYVNHKWTVNCQLDTVELGPAHDTYNFNSTSRFIPDNNKLVIDLKTT